MNCELPDVQAGFRKGRGSRDQTANIHWIKEKAREFQKVATAEFSKFADILSAALSQYHHLVFEISQLKFHHLH